MSLFVQAIHCLWLRSPIYSNLMGVMLKSSNSSTYG